MDKYPWYAAYVAAILETDQSKLPERATIAQTALRKRALDPTIDSDERHAIDDADRALKALWQERVDLPSEAPSKVNPAHHDPTKPR